MKTKILIVLSSVLMFQGLTAQKLSRAFDQSKVDTIYFFSPMGEILLPGGQVNEYLSISFKEGLETSINTALTKVHPVFVPVDEHMDSIIFNKLFLNISSIEDIHRHDFDTASISPDVMNILNTQKGRYVGFMFYNGFSQKNYEAKLVGSTLLFVTTLVLSAGEYYYAAFPQEPYAEAIMIIADKETGHYLFFGREKVVGDPLGPHASLSIANKYRMDLFRENKDDSLF